MSERIRLTRRDHWAIRMLTNPTERAALLPAVISGALLFMVFAITTVVDDKAGNRLVGITVSFFGCAMASIIFYLCIKNAYRSQRQAMDWATNLTLTGRDRADLYLWQRYGVIPQSKHLKPALSDYLDYAQDRAEGKGVMKPWLQKLAFFFFVTQVLLNLYVLIWGDGSFTNYLGIALFLLLALTSYPWRAPVINAVFGKLNQYEIRRLAAMRVQLDEYQKNGKVSK